MADLTVWQAVLETVVLKPGIVAAMTSQAVLEALFTSPLVVAQVAGITPVVMNHLLLRPLDLSRAVAVPILEDMEDNAPLKRYKMDADPRGYCLVIDNHEFRHQNGTVSTRTGSKQDRASLKKSFERLGFLVLIVEDLEDRDLKKWMKTFSQQDHTRFDCFVCCVLSHGCESGVCGVNDGLVNINEIISYFSAQMCPSLAGKPKLFFISACRGGTEMPGVRSAHTDSINLQPQPQQAIYIPNEADFFLGFSTVNSYVSYRDKIRGTYYIDELTKVLDKFGHREEIHELLTRVNDAVSRRISSGKNGEVYMQMPAPQNRLRKKLYFPPLDENKTQSSRSAH